MSTATATNWGNTIKNKMATFSQNIVVRFLLTFLVLHSVHWFTTIIYASYCIDASFYGFFKNMINGHSPICHALMMTAYYSQNNIYTLLGTIGIAAGMTWVSDKLFTQSSPSITTRDEN